MVITAVWLRSVDCRIWKNSPRWANTFTTDMRSRLACGRGIAERPDRGRRIGGAEDRRARDERGGPVVRERLGEVGLHAAVHRHVHATVAEERPGVTDLPAGARNERLPPEPGVDRHHEDEVQVVEDVLERVGWGRRVQRRAGPGAELADQGERAREVRAGLRMD